MRAIIITENKPKDAKEPFTGGRIVLGHVTHYKLYERSGGNPFIEIRLISGNSVTHKCENMESAKAAILKLDSMMNVEEHL